MPQHQFSQLFQRLKSAAQFLQPKAKSVAVALGIPELSKDVVSALRLILVVLVGDFIRWLWLHLPF